MRRRLVVVKKWFKPQRGARVVPTPREGDEQANLMDWSRGAQGRFPELALLFAIPNGIPISGPQRWAIIGALKRRGQKNGVPDLCLPVQRIVDGKRYGALYIEMKRSGKGGVHGRDQDAWIDALRAQGYKAEYCHGFKEAAELIISYLLGEKV